ncbi:PD-(D/E)XK nuclease family protein [Cellulophaga sp. L1A9]|uniref:PD-(D/E)XK nuclease family protein n=1 Tax=Cellulophaga sp. L1A9 TaxID=2686362 RepID=UPI00131C39FE|nr:PD-(D/E)XK nuclease family protein [Cellulophaga sp. L1A9]
MKLPSFFIDDYDSMKYEETIDFFMSWTIHCADEIYKDVNANVHESARKILTQLLAYNNANNLVFTDIKVSKQLKNIDLWIELKVDKKERILIIEDKMYSNIHNNQLQRNKEIIVEHYGVERSKDVKYALIRPDHTFEVRDEPILKKSNFVYFNLEQLADCLEEKRTGHDLFDEFWFNWTLDSEEKREKKI